MDITALLESFGYILIFVSVFIECGVLLGLVLPLPGFSLLFTAGVFAADQKMNLWAILVVGTTAAILGYYVGYYTGARYGRKLFYEKDTEKYFTKRQGEAAERFMKKYGYSTLIVGRFLPILHSVAPLLSGVAKTPLIPFSIVNVLGGAFWVGCATLLGYYLGQSVPNAQYYILPILFISIIFANTPFGRSILGRITQKIESM